MTKLSTLSILLPLLITVTGGCSGNSTANPSDVSQAVALVQQSLGHWKAGETLQDLREDDPPVYVADDDWHRGSRLHQFSIVGAGEKHGTNVRMRSLYLPAELTRRGRRSGGSTAGQFPYDFATEIFWIVSRVNNCHYCLGHQEDKLKRVGVSEARLVALDSRWTLFSPHEQAAFAFAKKLTDQPHRISDHDVADLATHYTTDQILELAFLVGRYNATNRWTDSLGIPQEGHRVYHSDLDADELTIASEVTVKEPEPRPAFSDYETWRQQLGREMGRKSRLQPSAASPESPADMAEDLPAHLRLLLSIPIAGDSWVAQLQSAETVGELPTILRDQIGFVAAREDNAWYMQWYRFGRLQEAGMAGEQIVLLGTDSVDVDPATREALRFATRLTSAPQRITDDDIESLAAHFNKNQIAEIVYHVGIAALLDRLTETAGLVAEEN